MSSEDFEKIDDPLHSEVEFDESLDLIEALEANESSTDSSHEVSEDSDDSELISAEGTELEGFESAEVEEQEFLTAEQTMSIIESLLFATDRPQSLSTIKQAFKGTNIKTKDIKRALEQLAIEYANPTRGVTLEEVSGGYQLRTKVDNMNYLRQTVKARPFKLSGPAMEVLSIVAYKQPCIKADIDEVRGVESGHLLRGLMERGLVTFAGKSDLPGKPMLYATSRKFLEIFGLRNIRELPSLSEIDELIPEGIGEVEEKEETLDQLTDTLSQQAGSTYSQGEEELMKITDELATIETSSQFFEEEKRRQKQKRDADRAQDIREALLVGEEVSEKDRRWLEKYELELLGQTEGKESTDGVEPSDTNSSIEDSLEASQVDQCDVAQDESEELLAAVAEQEPQGTAVIGRVDFSKFKKDLEIFAEEEPQGE